MQKDILTSLDTKHIWHPYSDIDRFEANGFPIIASAKGSRFYDIEGKEYIDAIASWWCVNFGHSHPRLINAIKNQAENLQHVILGGLSHEKAILLAEKLSKLAPKGLNRTLFASDGASAVEASLRVALQHRENRGQTSKKRFLALKEGYHGDTLGAVGVGFVERFHKELRGSVAESLCATSPHCARCPYAKEKSSCDVECFDSMEELIKANHEEVTALILEPLCQGSAGIRIYPSEYLRRARELCDKYDILLIADEIAVGLGRTGAMFACEKAGIVPDMMTLGKGLTGGYLPLSTLLVKDEIYDSFREGKTLYHGHTFSGNPIATALALEALEMYEDEEIIKKVARLEPMIQKRLKELSQKLDDSYYDTLGAIGMIDIKESAGGAKRAREICDFAMENGVFLRPLESVVYLWPPLNIEEIDINKIFETMGEGVHL